MLATCILCLVCNTESQLGVHTPTKQVISLHRWVSELNKLEADQSSICLGFDGETNKSTSEMTSARNLEKVRKMTLTFDDTRAQCVSVTSVAKASRTWTAPTHFLEARLTRRHLSFFLLLKHGLICRLGINVCAKSSICNACL